LFNLFLFFDKQTVKNKKMASVFSCEQCKNISMEAPRNLFAIFESLPLRSWLQDLPFLIPKQWDPDLFHKSTIPERSNSPILWSSIDSDDYSQKKTFACNVCNGTMKYSSQLSRVWNDWTD